MRRTLLLATAAAATALAACGGEPSERTAPATAIAGAPPQLTEHFVKSGAKTATPAAPRLHGRYITARLMHSTWLRDKPHGEPLHFLRETTEFGSRNVVSVVARRDGWLKVL